MPGGRALRSTVAFDIALLLSGCEFRAFPRIETHNHDLELRARLQGDGTEAVNQAVEHLIAQHRTAIVREHQDEGLLSKVVSQANRLASLVTENQVEWHLFIESLIQTDIAKQ